MAQPCGQRSWTLQWTLEATIILRAWIPTVTEQKSTDMPSAVDELAWSHKTAALMTGQELDETVSSFGRRRPVVCRDVGRGTGFLGGESQPVVTVPKCLTRYGHLSRFGLRCGV